MITIYKKNIIELKNAFFKTFINNNSFGKMFVPSISHKLLLYPTNGYYLSKKQFSALNRTIELSGEKSFYLSEIEGQAFIENNNCLIHKSVHLELSVNTPYDAYEKKIIIFENALYSKNGLWGGIISHEAHAIFGGSKKFIETFKNLYPDWETDQKKFIESVKYWGKFAQTDSNWVTILLKYINE